MNNLDFMFSGIFFLLNKNYCIKTKKTGISLGFAGYRAQLMQPNFGGNGLDWLCYLAGKS